MRRPEFDRFPDKASLRRLIGEKKRAMTTAEIDRRSACLAQRLFETEEYRRAEALYLYLSVNQEVRTGPIIDRARRDGKRVAVPRVDGDAMRFFWLTDDSALVSGVMGIPEPSGDGPEADEPSALIVVPGLAFDAQGFRVGYGGGYYDRYLASHPGHPLLALCYDFQFFDGVPAEDCDVPVDRVITDSRSGA